MNEEKFVVDEETAAADLDRVIVALDLDLDSKDLDEKEKKAAENNRALLLRAIRRGKIAVDEQDRFVVHTANGGAVVVNHPTGSTFMALDKRKEDIGKVVAALADVTKKQPGFFSTLPAPDFKNFTNIANLFFS